MQSFLVMQAKPETSEFQGIFSTEPLAKDACHSDDYYIMMFNTDEELAKETVCVIPYKYPTIEDKWYISEGSPWGGE